jgi:myosin-5
MLVHSSKWRPTPDIKTLCGDILQKSIKDQDKYQVGLTKIFFRAGMLAYLESLRSDRLNALVTMVQKNVRRRLAYVQYQKMRKAAIKIQSWWRGILSRQFVEMVRKDLAARRLQTAIRRYVQRKRFIDVRTMIIGLQSVIRGSRARQAFQEERVKNAAVLLQSLCRSLLVRRQYKSDVQHVIWMQSCIRRRLARKELKALRQEARSVSKFKEISYRLENKVVELTQALQKRTEEKKQLQTRLDELEKQLQIWVGKYEEADTKTKQLQTDMQIMHVPLTRFEELMESKQAVDKRLNDAVKQVTENEEAIQKLSGDLERQAIELEERQKSLNLATSRPHADESVVASLKNELASLREQLNRANALNSLTKGSRSTDVPLSPTYQQTLRPLENGVLIKEVPLSAKRKQRRHSSAGGYIVDSISTIRESDDLMHSAKRSQANSHRAVSVAFNGPDGMPRFRPPNGLGSIYDDPVEERIRVLEDTEHLDEDVLQGLVKALKIPQPGVNNGPSMKEVLFPANLVSLITNEMWKFGLIAESERFLAGVMQTIQAHVMSFTGEDAINPGIFWLSNVHEILSFICTAESDMLQGIGPGGEPGGREFDWSDYERLVSIVKHDLDSLEYNLYHTWMVEVKKRLTKMVIPALVESQSLPGFTTTDGGGRLFNRLLNTSSTPAFSMDDVLNLLNKVWKALKAYYMEDTVIQQVFTELLRLIGVTSFNDLLMRRNFCSWKRAMQIQYNITRIEEWCKSHDMPEGTLQLEHLMQATKLLQLKKATAADIAIIYDVCWVLTPSQIQRMCTNYFVADYENPISPEILRVVASRVVPNDRNDHLLLSPETEDVGPYELPPPREISGLETYVPAYLNVPHVRRLATLVE